MSFIRIHITMREYWMCISFVDLVIIFVWIFYCLFRLDCDNIFRARNGTWSTAKFSLVTYLNVISGPGFELLFAPLPQCIHCVAASIQSYQDVWNANKIKWTRKKSFIWISSIFLFSPILFARVWIWVRFRWKLVVFLSNKWKINWKMKIEQKISKKLYFFVYRAAWWEKEKRRKQNNNNINSRENEYLCFDGFSFV